MAGHLLELWPFGPGLLAWGFRVQGFHVFSVGEGAILRAVVEAAATDFFFVDTTARAVDLQD